MLLLALTGSLATGKSTVSSILSSPPHSLPVIDADVLARKVVEPGTRAYNLIITHFSPTTPDLLLPSPPSSNNNTSPSAPRPLNRAALGRRVFGTSPSRRRDRAALNNIVHPAVRFAMAKAILWHYLRGAWCVVLDVPLLYDSGLDVFAPVVLMVACRPATQMARLRARDPHLSAEEAADRVASQGGVEEKVRRTEARGRGRGVVVWNEGGKEELRGKVAEVVEEVGRGRRGWWWVLSWIVVPVGVGWGVWEVGRGWWGRRRWERERAREKEKEGKKE
ncbi:MAG: hypothetical protein LQ344_004824 [Seirophora lacunosa]|nr:MAG: hypothetical protein LQ344_004824 [Seirophora lacunosa]